MVPSVSVLTRFDCLDFQDLAGGRGLSPQQSCPLTFNFVPMGLRTWYTYVLFRLLFVVVVVVVVFFFLTPWFRYELLKPEPESKLWHTSRFNVRV